MGQSTNTCILYDKIQHSSDVLTDVSYSRANFNTNLIYLIDGLEQLSSIHDNALDTSISVLDEITQNINSEFDMIEKMSFDLLNVLNSFNVAEGKFNNDKLGKFIQNSDFVDDNIKENIKNNGFKIYSSEEGFEKNLTEEELKVLKQYKEKMEELTASKVISNFETVNEFFKLASTNSFPATFTATSLLIPSKTPLEFLSEVNGPYSKEGLVGLVMEKYPFLTKDAAIKVVEEHTGEEFPKTQDKSTTKSPVSLEGDNNNNNTPALDNTENEHDLDDSDISYRKNPSDGGSYSPSYDNFSDDYNSSNDILLDDNNDVQDIEHNENDFVDDNNNDNEIGRNDDNNNDNEIGRNDDIKSDRDDQVRDDNLDEKPSNDDTSNKTENIPDSYGEHEKSDPLLDSDTSRDTKVPKPTVLSQAATNFSTSIDSINTEDKGNLDLQTDDVSNITASYSDSKLSAIDDMLTYSPTTSKENVNTNSSSIAPVAIGLGLAGTTSIAANKIIKKKEKKQEDIINSFIDKGKDKEERRFIPLDAIDGDSLDNSSDFEKEDAAPSVEKEKTPEEWYDYIKDLY